MYWLVIPDSPFFILVIHYISLFDTYFINSFIKNNQCLLVIYIELLNYTTPRPTRRVLISQAVLLS